MLEVGSKARCLRGNYPSEIVRVKGPLTSEWEGEIAYPGREFQGN